MRADGRLAEWMYTALGYCSFHDDLPFTHLAVKIYIPYRAERSEIKHQQSERGQFLLTKLDKVQHYAKSICLFRGHLSRDRV